MDYLTARRTQQKFDIAVTAADRRRNNARDGPAEGRDKGGDIVANGAVHGGIADDTAFELRAAGFELGFDQCDELARLSCERQRGRQDQFKRDEADISDDEIGAADRTEQRVHCGYRSAPAIRLPAACATTSCNCPLPDIDCDRCSLAPRSSSTCVKPPVEAPTSRQTRSFGSKPKWPSAAQA